MADEKEKDEAAPAPEKKGMSIILVVVLVLVGVLLSTAGTYFIVTTVMAESNKEEMVTTSTASRDPGFFYKLGDADGILVNVGGAKTSKYLKIGIVLELNPGKSDVVTEGNINSVAETKILDTTMQFLRGAPLEDFDALKQDELKKRLKDDLNDRLGQGSVYDVYITGFLLQ